MLARAFATARSRLNFFQSLFVTDNVMSVTIVMHADRDQDRRAPPRRSRARPERQGEERRELAGDRAGGVHPCAAPGVGLEVRRVVALQPRARRRRPAHEVVGEADAHHVPHQPVRRAVQRHRPDDAGRDQQEPRERLRRHGPGGDRRAPGRPRRRRAGSRCPPRPACGTWRTPGTPPRRSARSGPRSGRRASCRASRCATSRQNPSALRSVFPAATAASIRSRSAERSTGALMAASVIPPVPHRRIAFRTR